MKNALRRQHPRQYQLTWLEREDLDSGHLSECLRFPSPEQGESIIVELPEIFENFSQRGFMWLAHGI